MSFICSRCHRHCGCPHPFVLHAKSRGRCEDCHESRYITADCKGYTRNGDYRLHQRGSDAAQS